MTFTATLVDRRQDNGVDAVTLVYSDGVSQKYARSYTSAGFTDAQLEAIAQNEVAGFNSATAAPGKSAYTIGSQINLTPPVVTPPKPDPAAVAQAQFVTDYRLWQSMQRGVSAGVVQQTDADAQLKIAQGEYLPAYQGML